MCSDALAQVFDATFSLSEELKNLPKCSGTLVSGLGQHLYGIQGCKQRTLELSRPPKRSVRNKNPPVLSAFAILRFSGQ